MNLATYYHVWNGSAYKIILKIVALQITASLCFVVGIVSFREIDETNENEPENIQKLSVWLCVKTVFSGLGDLCFCLGYWFLAMYFFKLS